jgi:hypothetical protein
VWTLERYAQNVCLLSVSWSFESKGRSASWSLSGAETALGLRIEPIIRNQRPYTRQEPRTDENQVCTWALSRSEVMIKPDSKVRPGVRRAIYEPQMGVAHTELQRRMSSRQPYFEQASSFKLLHIVIALTIDFSPD